MLYAALDDFYLTPEELEASPSRANGVDAALEAQLRRYGADAIGEVVVLLDLPQVVACTAQVLFQRFYCKRSLAQYDVKVVAMASFWLACKLEEVIEIDQPSKLRLRDVIMVFYRVIRRRDGKYVDFLDPMSQRYADLKTEVVLGERRMLRALGFVLHAEHPHHLVLAFARMLFLPENAVQTAWNLANDSLHTTLCVRRKAEAVACGALLLAARREGVPMPEDPSGPWWRVFGVSDEALTDVVRTLIDAQAQPKASYVCLRKDLTSRGKGGRESSPPPPTAQPSAAAEEQQQQQHQQRDNGAVVGAATATATANGSKAAESDIIPKMTTAAAAVPHAAQEASAPPRVQSHRPSSRTMDGSGDRRRRDRSSSADRKHRRRRSRSRSRSRSRRQRSNDGSRRRDRRRSSSRSHSQSRGRRRHDDYRRRRERIIDPERS